MNPSRYCDECILRGIIGAAIIDDNAMTYCPNGVVVPSQQDVKCTSVVLVGRSYKRSIVAIDVPNVANVSKQCDGNELRRREPNVSNNPFERVRCTTRWARTDFSQQQ